MILILYLQHKGCYYIVKELESTLVAQNKRGKGKYNWAHSSRSREW